MTRSECSNAERPCPHVGCRHHLALDVRSSGSIMFHNTIEDIRPDTSDTMVELWLRAMPQTCALDIADQGEHGREAVGELYGVTAEWIRQIEEKALAKLGRYMRRNPEL